MEEELLGMSVEFLAQARAQRLDEAHSSMEDTCFGKENHEFLIWTCICPWIFQMEFSKRH
jgi:hypothetical protein